MRHCKPSRWHGLAVACAASLAPACVSAPEPGPPLPPVAPAATLASVPSPPDVTRPVASFAIAPPSASPALELPRGGRTIFPDHRLVGFCGTPGAPALGPLLDHPAAKTAKLLSVRDAVRERPEASCRSSSSSPSSCRPAGVRTASTGVRVARQRRSTSTCRPRGRPRRCCCSTSSRGTRTSSPRCSASRSTCASPTWASRSIPSGRCGPSRRPGKFYGQATGESINAVIAYLSTLVGGRRPPGEGARLPPGERLRGQGRGGHQAARPGSSSSRASTAWGPRARRSTRTTTSCAPCAPACTPGFKLFFDEDRRTAASLMTPDEVMALVPRPEYVMYE